MNVSGPRVNLVQLLWIGPKQFPLWSWWLWPCSLFSVTSFVGQTIRIYSCSVLEPRARDRFVLTRTWMFPNGSLEWFVDQLNSFLYCVVRRKSPSYWIATSWATENTFESSQVFFFFLLLRRSKTCTHTHYPSYLIASHWWHEPNYQRHVT